ncbi:hypothetical protein I7I50_10743 [Histoplasma capsulatum G186AR]|uniref:Uncharacterized protein n=1 Tax=Ajellomyces capsulatus TaxID=5037 RepID=A0A8H7Z476_AJECA|nr:hypothetical protein I7I52_01982 [Histoplasma capsulatum]QSS69447.1 hypothetical protein I7I50_10743 [Histoplasma capsulatum G186AR]
MKTPQPASCSTLYSPISSASLPNSSWTRSFIIIFLPITILIFLFTTRPAPVTIPLATRIIILLFFILSILQLSLRLNQFRFLLLALTRMICSTISTSIPALHAVDVKSLGPTRFSQTGILQAVLFDISVNTRVIRLVDHGQLEFLHLVWLCGRTSSDV